jgi:hypothetical protein
VRARPTVTSHQKVYTAVSIGFESAETNFSTRSLNSLPTSQGPASDAHEWLDENSRLVCNITQGKLPVCSPGRHSRKVLLSSSSGINCSQTPQKKSAHHRPYIAGRKLQFLFLIKKEKARTRRQARFAVIMLCERRKSTIYGMARRSATKSCSFPSHQGCAILCANGHSWTHSDAAATTSRTL